MWAGDLSWVAALLLPLADMRTDQKLKMEGEWRMRRWMNEHGRTKNGQVCVLVLYTYINCTEHSYKFMYKILAYAKGRVTDTGNCAGFETHFSATPSVVRPSCLARLAADCRLPLRLVYSSRLTPTREVLPTRVGGIEFVMAEYRQTASAVDCNVRTRLFSL